MATSVVELLAEHGIKLRSYRAGANEHLICPRCEGGRTREKSLSVTVDQDGSGATWVCHRGQCGWTDGARIGVEPPPRRQATIRRPPTHTPAQTAHRPDWLYEYFAGRGIGARVVDKLGIYSVTRRFDAPIGETPTIVFPYVWRGEVVNRKYRPHPAKSPQMQERDAEHTLFNVDALGDKPDTIVWVEGEPDVMAVMECGITHVVSLKDGAPAKVSENGSEKRFEALRTHADVLTKARRIILAGDMDQPGLALREELARRLGRHRCWLVTWPADCKDANDTLIKHGSTIVLAAIDAAEPYPIDGVQRIEQGTLAALRARPAPAVLTTGTRSSDQVLKLPTEGRLIIVTGFPNHGKTAWTRFVMIHTATNHDRRWLAFSPESQPWEQFAAECAEVFVGKPFYRGGGGLDPMTDDEVAHAETWLHDHITMLVCDAEGNPPTIDWVLERAAASVLRDGTTDLLIDPWNEIDHDRGQTSETDYTGRALQRLKAFALRHGCNVWIIAHPAKPLPTKPGERPAAPGPYSIAGSAHWANKTDVGITIHSPAQGETELHLWKSRFRRWGTRGAIAKMEYEQETGRFLTPIALTIQPHADDEPPADLWTRAS